MATKNANQQCPCGSGLKRKKCESFHPIFGPEEDPDQKEDREMEAREQRRAARRSAQMALTAVSSYLGS